jgi:hypothetical protein
MAPAAASDRIRTAAARRSPAPPGTGAPGDYRPRWLSAADHGGTTPFMRA